MICECSDASKPVLFSQRLTRVGEFGTAFQKETAISRLTDNPFKSFHFGFSLAVSGNGTWNLCFFGTFVFSKEPFAVSPSTVVLMLRRRNSFVIATPKSREFGSRAPDNRN